ncbi:MAG: type IV pilus modification protein PilV, partial [Halothiobacillaceae bacterium]
MTRKPQHGVTLIEVLIALLILSIGLLGIAALHSVGIAQNHSSWLRSQVTHHGYDIADRMRANRAAALAGDYDQSFPTDPVTCDPDLEPSG